MARVTATRHIQVGAKLIPVKGIKGLMQLVVEGTIEATAEQTKVIAQESRELVIDKLMAATPDAPSRNLVVQRPPRLAPRADIPGVTRRPYRHEPLARRTIQDKLRRGEDGRKLIAVGDYIRGIEARKFDLPGAGVAWGVGLEDRTHEPSGLPLDVIGRIHEKGSASAKIPPRPHWRPVWRNLKRKIRERGLEARAEGLRRAIRRMR